MMIRLSDKEASVLLGATLMHWGVPFRTAARRELTEHQQGIVEEASDKLIGLREQFQKRQAQEAQEVLLTDEQAALLIAVVEDCLNECGDDPTELSLQLKTSERNEVETLLQRLRASLGSRFAKLA
jgi:phage-related minor tail protein